MKKSNPLPLGSWLSLFAFAVIIYFVSSINGNMLPEINKFSIDKVAHLIEYCILTFLVIRAVRGSFPRLGVLGSSVLVAVIVLAFAALDERHQKARLMGVRCANFHHPGPDIHIFRWLLMRENTGVATSQHPATSN